MEYPGFVSGSYQSQSVIADAERTVNWYPEIIESQGTKMALYPCPGFRQFIIAGQITDVGARALFAMADRCFAVIGPGFYELFATGLATRLGTVTQDAFPATISYNGQLIPLTGKDGQLFITSGGNGYCYTLATSTLTQVLTGEATMGAMLDGFFLAFNVNNGRVRLSNPGDGTTWDATQFFQRSIAPDPWKTMLVDSNRKIWLIGEQTGEIWWDQGNFPQPMAPIGGAVFGYGTPAPFSGVVSGSRVTWLSQTKEGGGVVVSAQGYIPTRVSNHGVETQIGTYLRNFSIADAEALTYLDQGHTFTMMTFPSAGATWGFDPLANNLWHERGFWNSRTQRYDIWKPRVHCYAFGRHLTGDRSTGIIAEMDITFGSEYTGDAIRRLRIAPGLVNELDRIPFHRLQLLMDVGLGLNTGQGSDPMIMMDMSNDGGRTYGNERMASVGRQGQYRRLVQWWRLGVARDRVFRVSTSDPIPWRIMGAFLNNADSQEQPAPK